MWWSTRLFLIHLFPILCFRSVFVHARHGDLWSFVLGGLSDALFTGFFVLFLVSIQVRNRTRAVLLVSSLFWWLYHALVTAYFAAMNVLPAPEQARYLLDPHFLLASLNAPAVLALFFLCAICLVLARLNLNPVPIRPLGLIVLILLFVAPLLHWGDKEQASPLLQQITAFVCRERELSGIAPQLTHDLSGVPMTTGTVERPNVLLIVLEGIPGGYLPQNVEFVNSSSDFFMPKTGRWAERGLLIPNFLAHRNQTINGLYSMLCADYPRLTDGTLITQELLSDPSAASRDTLPNVLARNGYATTYLQAAGLRFMDKDRFMSLIGFEEVLGEEWFDPSPPTFLTRWGINDRDFFLQSLKKIGDLNERRRRSHDQGKSVPWFLTLLTVGTHHPYTLPDDYKGGEGLPPKLRSVAFLDEALDLFLSHLEREGVLEDTLVIVTSDESHGMNADVLLDGNWGLCFALMPQESSEKPHINSELFCLADLPLSILDYAGFAASSDRIAGRSIFRNYKESAGRSLPGSWGDRFFIVSPDAVFLKDFGPGGFVKLSYSGSPFALSKKVKGEPLGQGTGLLSWAARTEGSNETKQHPPMRSWRFLPNGSTFRATEYTPSEDILKVDSKAWLSGGQYIQFEKGERYDLELQISAPKENGRHIKLDWQIYKLNGELSFLDNENCPLPVLAPGEQVLLSCSVEVRESFMLDSARLAVRAIGAASSGEAHAVIDSFALLPRKAPIKEENTGKILYQGADAHIVLEEYKGPSPSHSR